MSNTIKPADRLSGVGEYYLQRKMKEAAALNARGLDIISLGIGGPDMMPPAEAIETLCTQARRPDTHSYQLGIGVPELRNAFADAVLHPNITSGQPASKRYCTASNVKRYTISNERTPYGARALSPKYI